jgi:6-pyruvoyltetrahydropterin/6-carboxytetrahydropterin synthase|tara:strand:+ start:79 stop:486 length:408 start_codon:yes stop_codon:yes gene_type:complete
MRVSICRKGHFNAAHRLYNNNWSKEKNKKVFGICSNENFHGHNYELTVKIYGELDKETGMVFELKRMKDIIKKEVEDVLDHKNLNLDIPYFKNVVPTTENLAIFIWKKLYDAFKIDCKLTVILYETPRNFVEFSG